MKSGKSGTAAGIPSDVSQNGKKSDAEKQDFLDAAAMQIAAGLIRAVFNSKAVYAKDQEFAAFDAYWKAPWDIAERLWEERQKRYGNKPHPSAEEIKRILRNI